MKITIQKFQELYEISKYELEEMDKSILLVKALTGMNDLEIEEMPIRKYNKICKEVNQTFQMVNDKMLKGIPKNIVRTNGKWYRLNYDIAKPPMSAGRYVEVASFSEDIIGNLHKIMASMATPMKFVGYGFKPIKNHNWSNHDQIANDMLFMDFKHAFHAGVFFWAVFSRSIQSFRNYFVSLNPEKEEQVDQLLRNLQEHSDGFTQAKWYQSLKGSL